IMYFIGLGSKAVANAYFVNYGRRGNIATTVRTASRSIMLKFNGAWRFDSPGHIASGVSAEFSRLIGKVASQGDSRQSILEHFKSYFASAAGTTSSWSSSASWAESDLDSYMSDA